MVIPEARFTHLRKAIFSFCIRRTRHTQDADDETQKLFLKLWQVYPDQLPAEPAPGERRRFKLIWVAARNRLRNLRRDKARQRARIEDFDLNTIRGREPAPSSVAEARERSRLTNGKLDQLPDSRIREVAVRHFLYGESVNAIAGATGWSVSTVKRDACRAREELRKSLSNFDPDLGTNT
jgi:RNA polymerase sigma factor (sigma-70 family)